MYDLRLSAPDIQIFQDSAAVITQGSAFPKVIPSTSFITLIKLISLSVKSSESIFG